MQAFQLFLIGWAISAIVMTALYFIYRKTRNAGIVDIGWTALLGIVAVLYALLVEGYVPRKILLICITGFWSLRLTYHLVIRYRQEDEDGRYQALRAYWGNRAKALFFWLFQAQAFLVGLLSLSFIAVLSRKQPALDRWDYLGIVFFLISVIGETVADRQLACFRQDQSNKGKTCRVGLWRYSRHPNYFFEWLHWWVYVLIAANSSNAWLAWFNPILMFVFILYITGIPPTEIQAVKSRGEDYRHYQQTTSSFFPWFPKEEQS